MEEAAVLPRSVAAGFCRDRTRSSWPSSPHKLCRAALVFTALTVLAVPRISASPESKSGSCYKRSPPAASARGTGTLWAIRTPQQ
jgi:hypothetical protein